MDHIHVVDAPRSQARLDSVSARVPVGSRYVGGDDSLWLFRDGAAHPFA